MPRCATGPPHGVLAAGERLAAGRDRLRSCGRTRAGAARAAGHGTGINNVSVVFLGQVERRRFLLMGDVEEGIDPTLLAEGLPRVDVLKVAHHGSGPRRRRRSSMRSGRGSRSPRRAPDNPYGHPARLDARPPRERPAPACYRTDQDGSVDGRPSSRGLTVRDDRARGHAGGDATADADARCATRAAPGRTSRHSLCAIPVPVGSPRRPGCRASRTPARVAPDRRSARLRRPIGYHRGDDGPRPPRGRPPAALPRSRRRGSCATPARWPRSRPWLARPDANRGTPVDRGWSGRGAPPRRRQAAARPMARPPPARRGLGGLARGARLSRSWRRRSGTTR